MNNSKYWAKRIDEIAKIQFDKADEAEKELIKAYQRADKYIQERINLYYVRYAKENEISLAESKKILSSAELNNFRMTLEEFIEKAKNNQEDKWTKELNEEYLRSRISRYDALRYEINNKVKELKHEQLNITKSHLKDAYSDTYYRTAYELEKGTGIGVNFAKLNDRAIENAVYTKWLDNKNFEGRMDDDKTNLISNLNKIITQGMITGSSSTEMVNKLIKAMKVSRNRAINLIQTETTFVIGQANTNMYKEFGVTQYEVLETLDSITCETCAAMDGKRFKVSEKQEGLNAPPFHPRCRGTTIPVSKYEHIWGKGDRIARDENGKTYYKTNIGDISYEKYIENKLKKTENDSNIQLNPENIQKRIAEYGLDKKYGNVTINSLTIDINKNSEDFVLKDIVSSNGFADKPRVVSKESIDNYITDGYIELFRGIRQKAGYELSDIDKFIEQLKFGDYFAGKGMFGNGIYTTKTLDDMQVYANNGKMIRMCLDKTAKTYEIENQISAISEVSKYVSNSVFKEYEKAILSNLGRLKALQGYDAIYIKSKNYYVILNRGKLIIEE